MRSVSRREDQCRTDDTCVLGVRALEIGSRVREMLACTYLQPLGDMPSCVDTQSVSLVTGVLDDTALVRIAARKSVIAFVGTPGDRSVVLLRITELVDLILPVRTGHFIYIAVLIRSQTRVEEVLRCRVVCSGESSGSSIILIIRSSGTK